MKREECEHELRHLQGELVARQDWVEASGARIYILFDGPDSAGKGGRIRRITERFLEMAPLVERVMLLATDSVWAPWFVVDNENKRRGRIDIISHLLSETPHEPVPMQDVKLPEQPTPGNYVEPDLAPHHIPTPF